MFETLLCGIHFTRKGDQRKFSPAHPGKSKFPVPVTGLWSAQASLREMARITEIASSLHSLTHVTVN